jgi:hypothetical protein
MATFDASMFSKYALEGEVNVADGERMFPVNSIWATKEDLKEVTTKYGLSFGFKMCNVRAGMEFPL